MFIQPFVVEYICQKHAIFYTDLAGTKSNLKFAANDVLAGVPKTI